MKEWEEEEQGSTAKWPRGDQPRPLFLSCILSTQKTCHVCVRIAPNLQDRTMPWKDGMRMGWGVGWDGMHLNVMAACLVVALCSRSRFALTHTYTSNL